MLPRHDADAKKLFVVAIAFGFGFVGESVTLVVSLLMPQSQFADAFDAVNAVYFG